MGEVVNFTGGNNLDLDPNDVLAAALDKMSECMIIGYDKEGGRYIASSTASGPRMLWWLEKAKEHILEESTKDR